MFDNFFLTLKIGRGSPLPLREWLFGLCFPESGRRRNRLAGLCFGAFFHTPQGKSSFSYYFLLKWLLAR